MGTRTRYTAEDLWRMPSGDVRRELVNGEIVEMAPAGALHGKVLLTIGRRLQEHVVQHGGGELVAGDVGFVLSLPSDPERVRAPDVAFISTRNLPGGELPEKFVPGAPDLAVEVLSPSESSTDVQQKVRDYFEAGTRLVWVLAPKVKTATVYRADGSAQFLRENDQLKGEDVLPGFSMNLREIFG